MPRRWLLNQLRYLLGLSACLFIPAGALNWQGGWRMLALHLGLIAAQALLLSPDLLAERATSQQGAKAWDIPLSNWALLYLPLIGCTLAGLQFRSGWPLQLPAALIWPALTLWIVGAALILWAMRSNPYFAPLLRIQRERGQRPVDQGPYALIRHPGYLGALLCQVSAPALMGSLWACLPAFVAAFLIILRTHREDWTLRGELPGYWDYAERVRWRLVPGLW